MSRLKLNILLLAVMLAFGISMSHAQSSRYAEHSVLSQGKWVKIRVADEGVHQITPAQIKSMGFSAADRVRLYGYNLPVLPEALIENISDDLTEIPLWRRSDGSLLFYSKGTTEYKFKNGSVSDFTHKNNPYSKYLYYFVTEGKTCADGDDGTPKAFGKEEVEGANSKLETFPEHVKIEEDRFSFINAGRVFFESYDFILGATKRYTLKTPGIAADDVALTVAFGAANNKATTLSVKVGTDDLGTMTFQPLVEYKYADVRTSTKTWRNVSRVETNTVVLQFSTGATGHLDYIKAGYMRSLDMGTGNYLAFRTNADSKYNAVIANANANTRVWRVTSPDATTEIAGLLQGTSYTAGINATTRDEYVAVNVTASFPSVDVVGKVDNQDLHALKDIDLLIVIPSNGILEKQAKRLAEAHVHYDSIRCAVVRADKIYNEFSSGTPDATAYRRLMKMLYDKAESSADAPKNILLFGACHWDNRFVTEGMTSKKQDDFLLCYESDNGWSHTESYVLEEYFTLLADGKGVSPLKEKLDCGVGRLPVATEAEARTVVDKLIRYMSNEDAGVWKNTICLMADDGNANLHMRDVSTLYDVVSKSFPDFYTKRIYWDAHTLVQTSTGSGYPTVYAEINKTMRDGALIMDYTGHGAAYCLSHEQVLKTKDFKAWDSPRLPLWITAACDVCPFDMNTENLAVHAVLNAKGAAMGFIGTARTVYSSQNLALNRRLLPCLLQDAPDGGRYTIGEALAAAKNGVISAMSHYSKTDSINKTAFVLMGDPAITLQTPRYKVVVDKMGDADAATLRAGDIVTMEGHIEDEQGNIMDDYQGLVSPKVFDNVQHIVCKNNDKSADKAYEYDDRTRVLFTGCDSVINGRFKVKFPVPMDINYSDEQGLIYLYAVSNDMKTECNGTFSDFVIGGTNTSASTDSIGPRIAMYLNYPEFPSGGVTDEAPTLFVQLSDSDGINTTGNGLGHDITVTIDNKEALTFSLNSYYTQSIGDYTSGTIEYKLTNIPTGSHQLTVRAFDVFNNMGESTLQFTSVAGLLKEYEVFDMSGRKLSNQATNLLKPGVYVYRVTYSDENGEIGHSTKKFAVTKAAPLINIIAR